LEYGSNVILESIPECFLQSNLITYKYKKPQRVNDFHEKGYFTEFKSGKHLLKIYNKGLQQNNGKQYNNGEQQDLSPNLIRVETAHKHKRELLKFGVHSLNDLKNPNSLELLKASQIKALGNLLIVDEVPFPIDSIESKYYPMLANACNPNFWEGLTRGDQWRRRQMTRVKRHLDEAGQLSIHKELVSKVDSKLSCLIHS